MDRTSNIVAQLPTETIILLALDSVTLNSKGRITFYE